MTMKLITLFLTLILLLGCKQQSDKNKANEGDTTETHITEPVEMTEDQDIDVSSDYFVDFDDPPDTKEEMQAFLEAFVTPNQVRIFMEALDKYPAIDSDAKMADFYMQDIDTMIRAINNGMWKSHPHVEYAGDSEPADDWAWISNFMPYIITECPCSECESAAFINIVELETKANKTTGKIDDTFFETLFAYFGIPGDDHALVYAGNTNNWFTMDGCDFCNFNNLGNGNYTNMINKTIATEKLTDRLDDILEGLVQSALYVEHETHFGSSKEDVLNEINSLLLLQENTKFDLSNLEKLKTRITTAGEDIQYNCASQTCEYDFY